MLPSSEICSTLLTTVYSFHSSMATGNLSLVNKETHTLIPFKCFNATSAHARGVTRSICSLIGNSVSDPIMESPTRLARPFNEVSRDIHRVHDHICGHHHMVTWRSCFNGTNFGRMKFNDTWVLYSNVVLAASQPLLQHQTGKSQSVQITESNDVVFIDHFWLENICLFHAMDSFQRISKLQHVPSKSLSDGNVAFENLSVDQFWPPSAVHGDLAVMCVEFISFLSQYNISFRSVPPRRPDKNKIYLNRNAVSFEQYLFN